MNKTTRFTKLVLALFISSGVIAGCSTPASTKLDTSVKPNSSTSPTSTNATGSTTVTTPSTTQSSTATGTTQGNTSSSTTTTTSASSNQSVNDLASYQEDEAGFSDSSTIMTKQGFSTKAELNLGANTDIKASASPQPKPSTTEVNKEALAEIKASASPMPKPSPTSINKDAVVDKANQALDKAVETGKIDQKTAVKIEAGVKTLVDNQAVKNDLIANGVITVDASGTVTSVDKANLKSYLKDKKEKVVAYAKENEDKIKAKVADLKVKFSAQLEAKTGVSTEDLKNKTSQVRKSDVVKVENADGTVTQTMNVNFTSPNGKLTKDSNVIRNADAKGNLTSLEQNITIKTSTYTKTSTRIITVNADGSRKTTTSSITTWTNGKKREITEERNVAANGSGTGTGSITITENGKEPVVKTLSVTITADGKVTTTSGSTDNSSSIKLEQGTTGEAKATVTEEGKSDVSSTVNVETTSEAEAAV